jgi:hypothetical protein
MIAMKSPRLGQRPIAARSLPSPESIFAEWLLWLPRGTNPCDAARAQLASLDRRSLDFPEVQRLRALLAAVAGDGARHQPITNPLGK